jgi:hypothetical protein
MSEGNNYVLVTGKLFLWSEGNNYVLVTGKLFLLE